MRIANFLGKVKILNLCKSYCFNVETGYKVGRVDQAETALGAEMRMASDKKSGKGKATEKDKIVRRFVGHDGHCVDILSLRGFQGAAQGLYERNAG